VLENVRGCVTDGPCFLKLALTGGTEAIVTYHPGEGPSCPNDAAATAGIRVEPGQRVAVTGRVVGAGPPLELTTCPDESLAIRPLGNGEEETGSGRP
ncbi:MAG: hypothetical protein D6718_10730, partial [Acidobacteria bacterium]